MEDLSICVSGIGRVNRLMDIISIVSGKRVWNGDERIGLDSGGKSGKL